MLTVCSTRLLERLDGGMKTAAGDVWLSVNKCSLSVSVSSEWRRPIISRRRRRRRVVRQGLITCLSDDAMLSSPMSLKAHAGAGVHCMLHWLPVTSQPHTHARQRQSNTRPVQRLREQIFKRFSINSLIELKTLEKIGKYCQKDVAAWNSLYVLIHLGRFMSLR